MPDPAIRTRSGAELPQLGFGVWQVPDDEVATAVQTAIESGYRLVDTAQGYANERGTGEGIRRAGVDRSDLFVTTKLDAGTFGYDDIRRAFDASLEQLGLDHIDAYLIHWPRPAIGRTVETWEALRRIRDDGQIRAIGVCNFEPHHLREIVDATGEVPELNQVELHPWLPQDALRAEHARLGIVTQAWSPLASGALLDDPAVVSIAEALGAEPAQVILAWHRARGDAFVVKSVTPERIRSNLAAGGIRLADDQLAALDGLGSGRRTGPHPDEF